MRFGFAWLVAIGVAFGCSGGGGGAGTSSGGGASKDAMCSSYCDWKVRCGKQDNDCVEDCADGLKVDKFSAAYTSMFQSCFQGLACSEDDDACVANFGGADPAYPNIPEVTACNEKRAECSQSSSSPDGGTSTQPTTSWSDDYCLSLAALTPAARSEANSCLAQPCAGIRDCLIRAGAFNY